MKAEIIYDSRHGNTEKIARAIADGVSGAIAASGSVEVIKAADAQLEQLTGVDILLVGSPTHGSNPSPAMHDFLQRVPGAALAGVRVAAFDTRTDATKQQGTLRFFAKILDHFGYAAPKISAILEKRGGRVIKAPEGFFVKGTEGPLEDGELERAADWARSIVG